MSSTDVSPCLKIYLISLKQKLKPDNQLRNCLQLPHILHLALFTKTNEEDKSGWLSKYQHINHIESKFQSLEDDTISRAIVIGETTLPLDTWLAGITDALKRRTFTLNNVTKWQRQDWVFFAMGSLVRRSGCLHLSVFPEELALFLESESSGIPVNIDRLIRELYSYKLKDGVWTLINA